MARLALCDETLADLSTEKVQEELYDSSFSAGGSFGVRLSRSGRKAFFLVYSFGGRRKRVTLGLFPVLSYETARKRAIEFLRVVETGTDPVLDPDAALTFSIAAGRFLDSYGRKLKRRTVGEYKRIIQRELVSQWGDRLVSGIRSTDVQRLLHTIAEKRGRNVLAARTFNLCRVMFAHFVAQGLCSQNPCDSVQLVTDAETMLPRSRELTLEEIALLWRYLESNAVPEHASSAFKLLLLTGQRPSDVLAMRWSDLQLDSWHIPSRSSTTHPSPRVPLSHVAANVLIDVRRKQSDTGEFVFTTSRGAPLRSLSRETARLNTLCGFDSPFSPKTLRYSVVRQLEEMGTAADLIEYAMLRSNFVPKFQRSAADDLFPAVRRALTLWAHRLQDAINACEPARASVPEKNDVLLPSNVVPLFKRDSVLL